MTDILQKAEAIANCKTCRWDQFCVKPPIMTRNEMENTFREMKKDARNSKDAAFVMLVGTMVLLGKDMECPTCPIFARRIRETPTLSQKIKKLMQGQKTFPQCRDCGWEKFCLRPPLMTEEEKKARVEKIRKQDDPEKGFMETLIGSMILDGKDTECPACPVFIKKLRKSSSVAQQIKKIMQN